MRIIPRNTKVATEFFTGVSLADIVVGAIGIMLLFFVVVSNLPWKIEICGGIGAVFVLLLVRIDTEPNYMFIYRIIKHFSYYRHFRKVKNVILSEEDAIAAEEQKKHLIKQKPKTMKKGKATKHPDELPRRAKKDEFVLEIIDLEKEDVSDNL